MAIEVKICGLKHEAAVEAAVAGGARYLGFVFHPKSPRAITAERAAALRQRVPKTVLCCGLFVDADADAIATTADRAGLDIVQLHGGETPEQARQLRHRTGRPVMKALGIASSDDLVDAGRWAGAADMVLLDAKPPRADALTGGNGRSFDWRLLEGLALPLPWMLAGGLSTGNLAEAIVRSGATRVDVSSGVESAPGVKDPALIAEFLARARAL